jgi:hypothetical protein
VPCYKQAMPVRIRRTNGARACEALLLRDLAELRAAAGDAAALREPIRIVVPSTSLRRHLEMSEMERSKVLKASGLSLESVAASSPFAAEAIVAPSSINWGRSAGASQAAAGVPAPRQ